MSHGHETSMRRPAPSSTSSRLAALKGLVPPQQRDAFRSFFDRRVPTDPAQISRAADSSGILAQDRKVSWREWAGGKIKGRSVSMSDAVEKVSLFPGWASRSYHDSDAQTRQGAEFSLEVFISGFAASYVPPESATRSQRAFMRLAKAYASLPKLPTTPGTGEMSARFGTDTPLTRSTEDLLKNVNLPPRPSEMTEEMEMDALEKQFQKAELDIETGSFNSLDTESTRSTGSVTPGEGAGSSSQQQISYVNARPNFAYNSSDIYRLHENLNARLQPFWSRALSNRTLRISIYCQRPTEHTSLLDDSDSDSEEQTLQPIYTHCFTTDAQGAFEARIRIPWERMCLQPAALQITFSDAKEEPELFVCTDLLPASTPNQPAPYSPNVYSTRTIIPVTITHSQVRLISDIDDTIKLSDILGGVRRIFHNVFVRGLEELVIQGMGEWYTRLWSEGVRFHYVSNSPYELLPVINEFIKVSNLPRGSIKLRSYAGRSLFNGLTSTPASRKRDGIIDILNAFSGSRFFLVGDSGEQDLELYSRIAAERHSQILAIFIRDASASSESSQPIDDPTGEEIKRMPSVFLRSASYTPGVPSQTNVPKPLPVAYTSNLSYSPATLEFDPLLQGPSNSTKPSSVPRIPPPSHASPFATPTQNTFDASMKGTRGASSSLDFGKGVDFSTDYFNSKHATRIKSPAHFSNRPRAPGSSPRAPSEPMPTSLGLPSTFYDADLMMTSSPSSSSRNSRDPSPTPSTMQLPGSLTKTELQNLSPAERRRVELQERVYRARLLVPSHIPLRVFTKPDECVEAEIILRGLQKDGDKRGNRAKR